MDSVGLCLFLALGIFFHIAFVIQNRLGVLDCRSLLRQQDNVAACTGNGSAADSGTGIYQVLKIQVFRALDFRPVIDVDDTRAQHDAAVGVDLPADINGFIVGISAVPDRVNGSQGDIGSRIIRIIKRLKSLWCRHNARELPRVDDAG